MAVDIAAALRKLTSGQTLTNAEKAALGISTASTTPVATPKATVVIPDPATVAYADLTPAQRASMSSSEKTDYIKAAREAKMAEDASARAAADPMLNPTVRPAAPPADDKYVYYYGWIGGAGSGQWKLYRESKANEAKAATAETRSTAGTTQATFGSAVGANSVPTPTTPTTTPTTTTPTTTTPTTTTPTTTTPTTTTPTTTTPTTTTPTTTTPPPTGMTKAEVDAAIAAAVKAATAGTVSKSDLDNAMRAAAAEAEAKAKAEAREAKAAADALKLAQKVKASDRLSAIFAGYGLETLAGFIDRRIKADVSEDMLLLELYDQPEYQLRFPGMKALRGKGKTITEAEYIRDEKAFAQTARFFDIPIGFYDTPDDFGKLIGNLVSPKEFQDRLQIGQDLARSMSPAAREQLQELYNIGEGGITAYVLDSDRAEPILRKQAKAAQFVGFGREQGFKLEGMTAAQAEQIAGTEAYAKLTGQQLQTALGQASILRQTQSRLTGIEGEVYDENEALKAVIESSPEALLASQQRARREGARFGGSGGVTGSSLRSTPEI
jgi:hypothetical protein